MHARIALASTFFTAWSLYTSLLVSTCLCYCERDLRYSGTVLTCTACGHASMQQGCCGLMAQVITRREVHGARASCIWLCIWQMLLSRRLVPSQHLLKLVH